MCCPSVYNVVPVRFAILLTLSTIVATPRVTEACACCDSQTLRTPIGWTTSGGEVMIDMTSNAACSWTHQLEVWTIGATEPAGCYDLFADPDEPVGCGIAAYDDTAQERRSSQIKRFAKKAAQLPRSSVRLRKRRVDDSLRVTVDVLTTGGWKRLWSSKIASREAYVDPAGRRETAPLLGTVWPSPRGERALLLVENVAAGSGWSTMVYWVELPSNVVR